jgi:hypothetical protein
MKAAHQGKPPEPFANVEPLAKLALTRQVKVDTPDSVPTEAEDAESKPAKPAKSPPPKTR